MSNHSDLSLLTVSSVDPNFLNIGHRPNKLNSGAVSNVQRYLSIYRFSSLCTHSKALFNHHMLVFIHFRPALLSESNNLVRSCGKLSTLSIQRSFSTSDITNKILETNNTRNEHAIIPLRHAISELALNSIQRYGYMLDSARLSRSCSTWVAVGELASTSQLPSPHSHTSSLTMTSSQQQLSSTVNKNIRESYIRNRLLTTHRAIERLSQSEFNLDQLANMATTTITVSEATTGSSPGPGPIEIIIPEQFMGKTSPDDTSMQLKPKTKYKYISAAKMSRNLNIQDIEKERGRPLSKYDRNYMIFNWLHSLDQTSTVEDSQ